MQESVRDDCLKRLNYIDGHLHGVQRMSQEDADCADVLKQTSAVRPGLEKLEAVMLDGHLRTCAVEGIRDGRDQQVVDELLTLYQLANR